VSGGETLSGSTRTATTYTAAAGSSAALNITVIATSIANATKNGSATITVPAAPAISTATLAAGTVGTAYAATLTGSGGIAPYSWSLASGSALPAGLSVSAAGAITGIPMAAGAGTANVMLQMKDSGKATALSTTAQIAMTVTAAPAITFANSNPATITGVAMNGSDISGENFGATLAYTVTGVATYAGAQNGKIYVTLSPTGCSGSALGTAISGTGAFSIQGIPAGSYRLDAWMDLQNFGFLNKSDPSGTNSAVAVSTADLTVDSIALLDPEAYTLASGPTINAIGPADGGVVINFKTLAENSANGSQMELPDTYTVQWSTDSAFTSPATGLITYTGTATGPLYVGFVDMSSGVAYTQKILGPSSPQAYSIQVPSGTNYFFFGEIDQNNDGMIDPGDISNTRDNNSSPVVISGNLTKDMTLSTSNSKATVTTQRFTQTHCCPATSRTRSIGCLNRLSRFRSSTSEVPVEWPFSRTKLG
jgi:hypothetical protein